MYYDSNCGQIFKIIGLIQYVPKNSSDESSIASSNHDTRDEETTGNASSIRPTGNKEVQQEHDPEGGQRKGTCVSDYFILTSLDVHVCLESITIPF